MPTETRTKSETPADSASSRRSRASGRVTLSDVAQAAGVSPMTVSRALRGERRVAPALVDKVREVAASLGYVPDLAARALASQKSTQVLVLVPMLSACLSTSWCIAGTAEYHVGVGHSPTSGCSTCC